MAEPINNASFDAPIPGESMMHELGARPWQQPPKYPTTEEALGFYLPRFQNEEFVEGLLDTLELGVPVTSIANTLQTGAVMEGLHSIDVGIIILPVLVEMISYIAEDAGIEFNTGTEGLKTDKLTQTKIDVIMKRLSDKDTSKEKMIEDMPSEEVMSEETPQQESGLMSRRM
tara:strand:+ start:2014 stop:2529 length:516 start_codon:yes stop_codon:yes gene_type:complete